MIAEVVDRGTPAHRVFVGGFGHGGAAALHVAFRSSYRVGGAMCIAGAVPEASSLREHIVQRTTRNDSDAGLPNVLMCHGKADGVVPLREAKACAEWLTGCGVAVEWHEFGGVGHGECARVCVCPSLVLCLVALFTSGEFTHMFVCVVRAQTDRDRGWGSAHSHTLCERAR